MALGMSMLSILNIMFTRFVALFSIILIIAHIYTAMNFTGDADSLMPMFAGVSIAQIVMLVFFVLMGKQMMED